MKDEVQNIINEIYNQATSKSAPTLSPTEKRLLDLGLSLLGITVSAIVRCADALERSAAAHEGVRPAHDPLDAL